MVALAGMPLGRTAVLWKTAFWERKAFPEVWKAARKEKIYPPPPPTLWFDNFLHVIS
jgi:hypothetical protein